MSRGSSEIVQRVALYARYSSDRQSEHSIEDQLRICREHAKRQGWTVLATFQDAALSGASTQRAGFQALQAAMRRGDVDIVVAEALDRFSRDQEHVAAFHKLAGFAGVKVVTLAEGEISALHVGLKGTMNALFLQDLAAKTKRGIAGRVQAGKCFGPPPPMATAASPESCVPTASWSAACVKSTRIRLPSCSASLLSTPPAERRVPYLIS